MTWDEYRTCHEAWFDRLDTKHQGKVTLDEVKTHARNPARAQAMFEQIDTGHTGVVTREQYDTWLHKRFDSLDINHDGVLTPDEMRQSEASRTDRRTRRCLGWRNGPGRDPEAVSSDLPARRPVPGGAPPLSPLVQCRETPAIIARALRGRRRFHESARLASVVVRSCSTILRLPPVTG